MSNIIGYLHQAMSGALSTILLPISGLSPLLQLLAVSAVFGVVMVILFGYVSNQTGIREVKNRIGAALLEVVLFRYDTVISLRAQWALLVSGVKYFLLALSPVFILAIPFALILGHFNVRYGARPLKVGEESVLSVQMAPGSDLRKVELKGDPEVSIAGPVRMERERALAWRIRPTSQGKHSITLDVSGEPLVKEEVIAGDSNGAPAGLYLSRTDPVMSFLYPNGGESQYLSSGKIEQVSLEYPAASYDLLGFHLSWLSIFLIISMAIGYLSSRILGIAV